MPRGPEVVEFVEPAPFVPRAKPGAGKTAQSRSVDFKAIKSSVLDFGAQALSRKERLRKQEERLIALGCAPRKKQKVPPKIASAIHKAHVARDKLQKTKLAETGLVLPTTSKKSAAASRSAKPPKRRLDRGPDTPGAGTFRDGMLRLSATDPFGEKRRRADIII